MSEFYQTGPELTNTYASDPLLKTWIEKKFKSQSAKAHETLDRCGKKAANQWLQLSLLAEKNEPELVSFSPWGERIDEINLCPGWKELEFEAAREGIVATAYEREFGALSRLLQMSLLYLFHSSSAFVSCPLAMTDGAARCLELLGQQDERKQKAFRHLTSRDPEKFWTSGQWMTERTGGSDVSLTSTVAKKDSQFYRLYGTKWFTSATNAQMAMLLAKVEGTTGLSLFYVELRDEKNRLLNIEVHRLKDKLGTRALPTAELTLNGTPGYLVGEIGQGVKNISSLLNVTRVYNSICATSQMRRGLDLLHSYSDKRVAFGKKIKDQPLHAQTLLELEATWARSFKFVMHISELLGKEEMQSLTSAEKAELRAMTPVLKLLTARDSLKVISEVCEGFGGAGYIEDTGIPKLLRDAQVFSIWEGTTNVLSLDFLRALKKEPGAAEWFQQKAQDLLKWPGDFQTEYHQKKLKQILEISQKNPEKLEAYARDLSLSFGFLYASHLEI
jgi:putative acyl-CoA dehydrogenase